VDALRELDFPVAESALAAAIKAVGPLTREPDRETRLAAFEGRYDELQSLFSPLESAYCTSAGALRVKWLLYAADHADHFRP
jgi:hypothetical protein